MNGKSMVEKLAEHPLVRKVFADDEAKRNRERKVAIKEIALIQAAYLSARDELAARIVATEKDLKAIRDEMTRAELKLGKLQGERQQKYVETETALGLQRKILLQTYPETIDLFTWELRDLADKIQNSVSVLNSVGSENAFTGQRPESVSSNIPSINAALDYLRSSIAAVEFLKFCDLTDRDLEAEFTAIRRNVPRTDQYETAERPKPDVSLLMSDDGPRKPSWINRPY